MSKRRLIALFSWEKIRSVLQHPAANPKETVLIVGIFLLILLILLILVLFILSLVKAKREKKVIVTKRALIILSSVLVGLLAVLSLSFLVYSSNSRFCASCHSKEYKTWKDSTHRKAPCLACHRNPGIIGYVVSKMELYRMSVARVRGSYPTSIRAVVRNTSCLRCHGEITEKTVLRYGIRMSHKEPIASGYWCVDCHNIVAHMKVVPVERKPSMDKCIDCHNGEKVSAECKLCHSEDVGQRPTTKIANYPKVYLPPITSCRGCHDLEAEGCTTCHGVEMPHPPEWMDKITHARAAAFERRQVCLKCHDFPTYCNKCHRFPGHAENWQEIHGAGGFASEPGCMACHTKEMSPIFCGLCH